MLHQLRLNPELVDAPLSDTGVKQCLEASMRAASVAHLKTVFVSPLRRALQTAYLLFKEHPEFREIKFILTPLLRENMHTVCDIPQDIDDTLDYFEPLFPNLDTSALEVYRNRKQWYLEDLEPSVQKRIQERLSEEKSLLDAVLAEMD